MKGVPPAWRLVEIISDSYRSGDLSPDELHEALQKNATALGELARGAPKFAWRATLAAAAVAVEEWADTLVPPVEKPREK